MDAVQITIAPVPDPDGKHRIMIGFSNEHFSQCVNFPYTNMDDVNLMAEQFRKALIDAGKKCIEFTFNGVSATLETALQAGNDRNL